MNLFTNAAKEQGFSIPLHALRGIAAVIVLLSHVQNRINEAFAELKFTAFFNGSAAVTFFFVLSGLVVGASLAKSGLSYPSVSLYFHRRFFRIMPLMFVTVTLGGLYLFFIDPYLRYPQNPTEYGELTPLKWVAGYVGYSLKANPPTWSIFVELIGSLLIPIMLLSGGKLRNVLLAFIAFIALSLAPLDSKHFWHIFMISFFLGLSILIWGKWVAGIAAKLPGAIFWLVIALLCASFYLVRPLAYPGNDLIWIIYAESFSIVLVIGIIYYLPERFSLLNTGTFKYLGDISYSLYLTHTIILIILLNIVTSLMGNTGLAAFVYCFCSIACSFIVAQMSYRTIEMNGVKLGERLRKQPTPSPVTP